RPLPLPRGDVPLPADLLIVGPPAVIRPAALLLALAVAVPGCSWGRARVATSKFDRAAAARACRSASLDTLPPDTAPVSLNQSLQAWFQQHSVPMSSVGLGRDEVEVGLPPGCHNVAGAIRRRYGQHVRVRENVIAAPS